MAAGYCFGRIMTLAANERRRTLIALGAALTVAFVVVRSINGYGDPSPWSAQRTGTLTLISFLNASKYPPSLDFLLMTLGPAILVIGLLDRAFVLLQARCFAAVRCFYTSLVALCRRGMALVRHPPDTHRFHLAHRRR
jgi:uncharacterized membrane protein